MGRKTKKKSHWNPGGFNVMDTGGLLPCIIEGALFVGSWKHQLMLLVGPIRLTLELSRLIDSP